MQLHEMKSAQKSVNRKRKGRGMATGNGKTSGRGHGGQNSRSGGGVRVGFEGGQMPLVRRVPKRGFNNIFAKPLDAINLGQLEQFRSGSTVDLDKMIEKGLLSKSKYGVKILANGDFSKKLTVKAKAFSKEAVTKIEAAGGKAEVV